MKTRALLGPVLVLVVAACHGSVDDGDSQAPPTTNPPPTTPYTPPTKPANPPDPPPPPKLTSCGVKVTDPTCSTTTAAPTSSAAIAAFVKDDALPIRCGDAGAEAWDVEPLVHLFADNRIYMTGEVHGSNEIGIVSSVVFEALGTKKLVDTLGYELPMDVQPIMQKYVDTGNDGQAQQIIDSLAPNMFGSILTRTARALASHGISIKVAAVDIPYTTQIPVTRIQAIAAKLTSQAQKDNVLTTLPSPTFQQPTSQDIQKANQYFDHIMAEKANICAELSADDCDGLVAMTHALWATSNAFDFGGPGNEELWFARREEVIYYNLHTAMASPTSRMYLHMGAHHTNKYAASGGSRMAKEFAGTKGKVFSVAPAYGKGSVIYYGQDMNLDAEPLPVVTALSDAPPHPAFVSNTRPNATCVANPLANQPDEVEGGPRGQTYDGYIHYGQLTSEQRPMDTKLSRETLQGQGQRPQETPSAMGLAIRAFHERIRAGEATQIARGRFLKQH